MSVKGHRIENAVCKMKTDKAILVEAADFDKPEWIPLSAVHDDSEVFDAKENAEGVLIVEAWLADKRGWS